MSDTSSRKQALATITDLMGRYHIELDDIRHTLQSTVEKREFTQGGGKKLLPMLLGWIGGILAVSGFFIYTATIWNDLSSFSRVLISLGPGVAVFLSAFLMDRKGDFGKAIIPAYIFAGVVEPTGLFVLLKEYGSGSDLVLASVIVFGIMTFQYGLAFFLQKRTVLLFFTFFFGLGWFSTFVDHLGVNRPGIWLVTGASLLFMGWRLLQSPWKEVTPGLFLAGLPMLISSIYYYWGGTDWEIIITSMLLLAIACSKHWNSTSLYLAGMILFVPIIIGNWLFDFYTPHYSDNIFVAALGTSMIFAGHYFMEHFPKKLTPGWYLFGSGLIFGSLFNLLESTNADILYPIVPIGMIVVASHIASRTLLVTSLLALTGFIIYYSSTYFPDVVGWPLTLMLIGAILLVLSAVGYKLSQRIRTESP